MVLLSAAAIDTIIDMLADVGRSWVDLPVDAHVAANRAPGKPAVQRAVKSPTPVVKCEYCRCKLPPEKVTKEHLLPKSAGGIKKIIVCITCNRARGNSSTWPEFVKFIDANPDVWAEAVGTCKDNLKLATWMRNQFIYSSANQHK